MLYGDRVVYIYQGDVLQSHGQYGKKISVRSREVEVDLKLAFISREHTAQQGEEQGHGTFGGCHSTLPHLVMGTQPYPTRKYINHCVTVTNSDDNTSVNIFFVL